MLQQHNCLTIELPPEVDVEGLFCSVLFYSCPSLLFISFLLFIDFTVLTVVWQLKKMCTKIIVIFRILHLYIFFLGDTALIATEKLKQSGLIYSLSLDMVINRLRFAKILTIANKLFGSVAVAVIEELAVHGR